MGKIDAGVTCNIEGCNEVAIRSISPDRVKASGLSFKGEKRAYLCRNHYRELKKRLKRDSEVERWRHMG